MTDYLRFTVLEENPDTGRKMGILVAAHQLRDSGKLSTEDEATLREILSWFNEHLRIPSLLLDKEHYRGVSWFKSNASKPLDKIWQLKTLLESFDVDIEIHKASDPGNIFYSDKWQVVAKPRKGRRKN